MASAPHATIAWNTALRDASCARRGSSSCTTDWNGTAACPIAPDAAPRALESSADAARPRRAYTRSASTLTK